METVFYLFASILALLLSIISIGVIWKFFFDLSSKRKAVKRVRDLANKKRGDFDGT